MKLSLIGMLIFCLAALYFDLGAQETIRDSSTGETFPRTVSFNYNGQPYQLDVTGVATRKKLIIKIYSIAHYIQNNVNLAGKDPFQAILSDEYAKQITMKWVRDVAFENLQETYRESFRKVLSNQEYAKHQQDIDNYIKLFYQGAHRGDEYIQRWIPGGHLEVVINGSTVGNITNKEFVKALWSIWFGNKSVVDRNELISQWKK